MMNYMDHIIQTDGFKPKYFDYAKGKTIAEDNVAQFFGVQAARMMKGNPSIDDMYSTRKNLDVVQKTIAAMPNGVFSGMHQYMYCTDN